MLARLMPILSPQHAKVQGSKLNCLAIELSPPGRHPPSAIRRLPVEVLTLQAEHDVASDSELEPKPEPSLAALGFSFDVYNL